MLITNGLVFVGDNGFKRTDVAMENGIITAIGDNLVHDGEQVLDAGGSYVIPGLVDIHIHGALGSDFSDGTADAIENISRFLLGQGVTSFLGTSMALPEARLADIYRTARPLVGTPIANGATLRGINMEGPFFNVEKRGAQNKEYIVPPNLDIFRRLMDASGNSIRTVAVAPEVEGGQAFVQHASKVCNVSLAHSCASFDAAQQAFSLGANHVTHLFNGMPAFHHRDPGIVGAAVAADAFAEVICDGVHLHPAIITSVFRLFGDDKVCLISDAMRACGMPDGKYDLGGQTVTVADGAATIDSGSLAGSTTVLTDCLRRAVQFGIPLPSAIKAATLNPAKSVGLDNIIGSIDCGKAADMVILRKDLSLAHVICNGVLHQVG